MNIFKDKSFIAAVKERFPLSERTRRLISCASYDLYFGPIGEDPDGDGFIYEGFCSAVDEIRSELSDVSEGFYDNACGYWMDKEPEGEEDEDGNWQEPFLEEIYHIERKDVLRVLCGKELASYL